MNRRIVQATLVWFEIGWSVVHLSQNLKFKGLGLALRGKGKGLAKVRQVVEVTSVLGSGWGFNLNFDS